MCVLLLFVCVADVVVCCCRWCALMSVVACCWLLFGCWCDVASDVAVCVCCCWYCCLCFGAIGLVCVFVVVVCSCC